MPLKRSTHTQCEVASGKILQPEGVAVLNLGILNPVQLPNTGKILQREGVAVLNLGILNPVQLPNTGDCYSRICECTITTTPLPSLVQETISAHAMRLSVHTQCEVASGKILQREGVAVLNLGILNPVQLPNTGDYQCTRNVRLLLVSLQLEGVAVLNLGILNPVQLPNTGDCYSRICECTITTTPLPSLVQETISAHAMRLSVHTQCEVASGKILQLEGVAVLTLGILNPVQLPNTGDCYSRICECTITTTPLPSLVQEPISAHSERTYTGGYCEGTSYSPTPRCHVDVIYVSRAYRPTIVSSIISLSLHKPAMLPLSQFCKLTQLITK
ncbi:hypothetical protein J6590_040761 [Homalodisca vitripennis]|nr:hypothetical protein J6590_040761 [Homalodisca vitripennis]